MELGRFCKQVFMVSVAVGLFGKFGGSIFYVLKRMRIFKKLWDTNISTSASDIQFKDPNITRKKAYFYVGSTFN